MNNGRQISVRALQQQSESYMYCLTVFSIHNFVFYNSCRYSSQISTTAALFDAIKTRLVDGSTFQVYVWLLCKRREVPPLERQFFCGAW